MTLFEQLGGEPALRAIVDRFVDRVFDDTLIGFHFAKANRARIKAKEYEFAAAHLGGDVEYTGRPRTTRSWGASSTDASSSSAWCSKRRARRPR